MRVNSFSSIRIFRFIFLCNNRKFDYNKNISVRFVKVEIQFIFFYILGADLIQEKYDFVLQDHSTIYFKFKSLNSLDTHERRHLNSSRTLMNWIQLKLFKIINNLIGTVRRSTTFISNKKIWSSSSWGIQMIATKQLDLLFWVSS